MRLRVVIVTLLWWFLLCKNSVVYAQQDQTSARANTLLDDADDIQKQLDNEARDRIKYGGHKTIWVIHFPTMAYPKLKEVENITRSAINMGISKQAKQDAKRQDLNNISPSSIQPKEWNYMDQQNWRTSYPDCGGRAQSPVDLPYSGLIKARGARRMIFKNYDVTPKLLTVENDGRTLSLRGKWKTDAQPLIYGGAAHGRRYIFHSMTLHWHSEHSIGGFQYPMESQVLHISAEYSNMEEAINASTRDPLAFLAVANIYKFGDQTQEGLCDLLDAARRMRSTCQRVPAMPLEHYSPPLKYYACYQGSLTSPPCTEAVLWLVRANAMTVSREYVQQVEELFDENSVMPVRGLQPMNDRKTYFFRN